MAVPDEEIPASVDPLSAAEPLAEVGDAPPAKTVFLENFENGTGAQVIPLTDYVGADGTTYSADLPWLNYEDCNSLILQYLDANWGDTNYCNNDVEVRSNVQRMADVLGQVQAGVIGSTNVNTPVNESTAQTQVNHAVSAYTHYVDMAPNLVAFESTTLPITLSEGHFYTASIDVAEQSCTYANGVNNSKLNFFLVLDGVEQALQKNPIRACTDSNMRYYTSPEINGWDWGSGGGYVGAGTYYSEGSYLVEDGGAGTVSLKMTNETGASQGNDFAYDNIELVDVTPEMSKSFSPSSIEPGETTTLTVTVNNTEDLAEKNGWSFTDNLPAGLVIADPANVSVSPETSCTADVTATPGSSELVVNNGFLASDQASCEIVVDITTAEGAEPGTFENCAANINPSVGVVRPAVCAAVELRPGPEPGLTITKDADTANLTAASVGDEITYTFTITNTGNTTLENVTPVEVEFSGTGELSSFSPGPVTLEAGASQVFTATYVVTEADVNTQALTNTAKATGNMPGAPPIESPPSSKEIPVLQPGFEVSKSSDPESGASVVPGQTITYTVTGKNTGETVLDPVVITDDLSQALNNATLNDARTATVNGTDTSAGLAYDQRLRQLTWTGALQPGEAVTMTYSVTVNNNAAGELIENSVSASATPPGNLPPIIPEPPTTEHPVSTPGFDLAKTSNPENGSAVHPGDVITYTLSGSNTGNTVLNPVVITDDLGGIWDYAVVDTDSTTAQIGTEDVSAGLNLDEAAETLTWTGALNPGETVTITFAATVKANVTGVTLDNRATGTAQPPGGGDPLVPVPPKTEHPVPTPGFDLKKSSDPADGSEVNPGEQITYTLVGENTGDTKLDPVSISDDLSDVLAHATLDGEPSAKIGSNDVSDALQVDAGAQKLTWDGALEPGETVTITYTVVVNSGVVGVEIENRASGSAQPPGTGDPLVPKPPKTEHHVPTPGFALSKVADPEEGSSVLPEQEITYTLTGLNNGQTVLTDVSIVDDLSDVLDNATLKGDPVAYIGNDLAVPQPMYDEAQSRITWEGELEAGQSIRIVYTVTVNDDVAGEILENRATAQGTPPGGGPISPPPVDTEHFVPEPGFNVQKEADPADGTAVHPGQQITYTVTGDNTGGTPLNDVSIVDDLDQLLTHATYGDDATATVGSADVSSGLVYDADAQTLTWTGTLQPGQQVVITYSVAVNEGVAGVKLENRVSGSATPPGNPPVTPPDQEVEHPVPAPGFKTAKTSQPGDGAAVVPGDEIVYTVTGANTGDTVLTDVTVVDHLGEVLNNAELQDGYSATIAGSDVSDALVYDDSAKTLTWVGTLEAGQAVEISYTVVVNDDAAGTLLENIVESSATPPGPAPSNPPIKPVTPPVDHPVLESGFELSKSSNPGTGTEVSPGDSITYTVMGKNTGETVLDPVVVSDDLSEVLNNAELVAEPSARIGDDDQTAGIDFDEGTKQLTWTGVLRAGETVEIVYEVRVNEGVEGKLIRNIVSGEATPPQPSNPSDPSRPPTPPIVPESPETQHPVPTPGFSLEKSSNPGSGTAVHPGDKITYEVLATNTGETRLDPVVITDDLGGLWDYATLDENTLSATIGADNDVSAGLNLDANAEELTWTGTLDAGEVVRIAYQVTVNDNVQGVTLANQVTGEAQPPGTIDPIVPVPPKTEHPVPTPGFTLGKSSDLAEGAAVNPGETISYTLTGENTGETVLDPVVITDDLSQVLNNATLNGDPKAVVGDVDTSDGLVFNAESMQLSWTGALEAGESVTITYQVTVNDNVQGQLIKNVASGTAQPPGNTRPIEPVTPPVKHPVPTPGFALSKTSDPADGAAVVPGGFIAYTLTGENTGETALDPVVITDDLSQVLNNATINGDPKAVVGDVDVSDGLAFDAESMQLSWTGALEVGESVTIIYAVTVNDGVSDAKLLNRATGAGTPPGSDSLVPPPVETEHSVPAPGFEIDKTADPAGGTVVRPGQKVTYTVTGTNTGGTVLDPVRISDDLGRVIDDAEYNGDAKAVIGGEDASDGLIYDSSSKTIVWVGALQPGERVELTYSVTVSADASGGTLENRVSGSAQPPGNSPLTPPDKEVEHRIGVALSVTGLDSVMTLGVIALSALLLLAGVATVSISRRRRDA